MILTDFGIMSYYRNHELTTLCSADDPISGISKSARN